MSATETEPAQDPLEEVNRIAQALEGAGTAVQAYQESTKAKQELTERLEATLVEGRELGEAARAAIEAALEESSGPLKEARLALRRLQDGVEEKALQALRKEVEARRAALEGLRDALGPLAEGAGAAEGNLVDSREMLELGQAELDEVQAEIETLSASEAEAKSSHEEAKKHAEGLREEARKARESSKLAAAKLIAAEASVEARKRKIGLAEEARDEANSTLAAARAAELSTEDEVGASEAELATAKEDLNKARQAQLESSQALARVETADEEETAEAAASEALSLVATARNARNATNEELVAKQAAASEAKAKVAEAEEALAAAEAAIATAEEAAKAAEAKLEEQREAAGLDAAQAASATAHSAAELADLAEAALRGVRKQLEKARDKAEELEADQAELKTASTGNEAFVAAQLEELSRAKGDVDAAQRMLDESDGKLKELESNVAAAQGDLQQLLTALARVEKEREAYELLLEDLVDEVSSVEGAVEEEDAELADTGAWGSLESLFDDPALPPAQERSPPEELANECLETDISDVAPDADEAPPPGGPSFRLSVSLPGRHLGDYDFSQEEVRVGRDKDCDVVLDSPVVSRNQFSIRQHEGLFALVDAGTANGTFINGKRAAGLVLLNDGDGIGLGKYRLRFLAETHAAFDLAQRLEKVGGVELGGMTLRITPEESRRQDGEHDRVRGYLVLPNPNGKEPIRHPLGEVFSVGKDISCDLVLRGWFTPKRAAIITRGYDRFTLINVSPSGRDVSVNGEVVRDHRRLETGSRIDIYGHRFLFQLPQDA